MGLRHGGYCLGCCWVLMALLFVGGLMNLVWVAALAGFVLLEKGLPAGRLTSWASGAALLLWAAWTPAPRGRGYSAAAPKRTPKSPARIARMIASRSRGASTSIHARPTCTGLWASSVARFTSGISSLAYCGR